MNTVDCQKTLNLLKQHASNQQDQIKYLKEEFEKLRSEVIFKIKSGKEERENLKKEIVALKHEIYNLKRRSYR